MKQFHEYLDQYGEFGTVTEIHYFIVTVRGLPHIKIEELVVFESGILGEVFSFTRDETRILVFSTNKLKVGTRVVRTGRLVSIDASPALLGAVIDPLGRVISSSQTLTQAPENRPIIIPSAGIEERVKITDSCLTGIAVVDMMIPLGKGQKELIIGDRKTGKTGFVLNSIRTQVKQPNTVAVYAAIARKTSDIKKLNDYFAHEQITDKVVVVASSAHDVPSLIYLTPFTAMTIAEYFRDQGKDVIVILDDLSTHAKFFREISLISGRFPGRESYPGDIFYCHAQLMERSGNFRNKVKGNATITCLPIVETVEGDIAGYIQTNIMGMTDGHIFFDSNIFRKGRRPAINISLSVTRVGKQTQTSLQRDINKELTAFMSTYEKMQNFSHFGAELTAEVKDLLHLGDRIIQLFNQQSATLLPLPVQLVCFGLLWGKHIDNVPDERVDNIALDLAAKYEKDEPTKTMIDSCIASHKTMKDLLDCITSNKNILLRAINDSTLPVLPAVSAKSAEKEGPTPPNVVIPAPNH
jgi:F-type H+-transporting ATPase subunit alpha